MFQYPLSGRTAENVQEVVDRAGWSSFQYPLSGRTAENRRGGAPAVEGGHVSVPSLGSNGRKLPGQTLDKRIYTSFSTLSRVERPKTKPAGVVAERNSMFQYPLSGRTAENQAQYDTGTASHQSFSTLSRVERPKTCCRKLPGKPLCKTFQYPLSGRTAENGSPYGGGWLDWPAFQYPLSGRTAENRHEVATVAQTSAVSVPSLGSNGRKRFRQ